MSTKRRQNLEPVEIGPNGFPLCRFCKKDVYPPKRTMCSQACIHEYKLRSDIRYMRWHLFKRDDGICACCGIDTEEQYEKLREAQRSKSPEFSKLLEEAGVTEKQFSLRNSLWDADHVLEVADGGGLCGLANIQTLCSRCHRKKSTESMKTRRQR